MLNNPNNKDIKMLDNFFCHLGRAVKNDLNLIVADYRKVLRVIKSCKCEEHLDATNRLITYFYMKNGNDFLLKKLEKRFWFKKKMIIKK